MNPSVSDAPDWPNLELTMNEATLQVGSELAAAEADRWAVGNHRSTLEGLEASSWGG